MEAMMYRIIPTLFLSLFLIWSCSDDAENVHEPQNGGIIYTSQMITVKTQNFTAESYAATIGDEPITFGRVNDTIGVFVVPEGIIEGVTRFSVPDFNNLEIDYDVKQTILSDTPEELFNGLIGDLESFVVELGISEEADWVNEQIDNFTDFLTSSSDSDKNEMALYYQANKAMLDQVFQGELTFGRSGPLDCNTNRTCAGAFTAASGVFLTAAIAAKFIPHPLGKKIALVIAVPSGALAIKYFRELRNRNLIIWESIMQSVVGRQANEMIEFTANQSRSVSFEYNRSTPSLENENDQAAGMVEIFDGREMLTQSTNIYNTILEALNEFFGTNIEGLSFDDFSESATVETVDVSLEIYENYSFDISHTNLEMQIESFEEGILTLTIKVLNEDLVVNDVVESEITYTYIDYFNEFSGSFPIEVRIEQDTICANSDLYVVVGHDILPGPQYEITAIANLGQGLYDFEWSNGQIFEGESTFSSIIVTNTDIPYSVVVTDELGCSVVTDYYYICENSPGCTDDSTGVTGVSGNIYTDPRDGQQYPVLYANGKYVFNKNLNYSTSGSYCSGCASNGRLYTINSARNACPDGWRLVAKSELRSFDANQQAGIYEDGFNEIGETGAWWSNSGSWIRDVYSGYDGIDYYEDLAGIGLAVRCITGAPCAGIGDIDGDGICSDEDCDDNNSGNVGIDNDEDGFCSGQDCDDENSSIYPGALCDDGDPETNDDVYNENCICMGE